MTTQPNKPEQVSASLRKLFDMPLGTRFRYQGGKDVWILIDRSGRGLIASDMNIDLPAWRQSLCCVTDETDDLRTIEVEIVDARLAVPEPASAQDEMREAFEAVHIELNHVSPNGGGLDFDKIGRYFEPDTHDAWMLWQACAQWQASRQAVVQSEALRLLAEVFDAWENGDPCNECDENGETIGSYLGMAFRLDDETFNACCDLLNNHYPKIKNAAPAQNAVGVPDGYALVPKYSQTDDIVTALYRRFKDWSQRGFGPDDVTWCDVKADVLAIIAAAHLQEPKP